MARYAAKSFRETLSIAKVAPARDLGAARYRVPSCVRPFDLRGGGHNSYFGTKEEQKRRKLDYQRWRGVRLMDFIP